MRLKFVKGVYTNKRIKNSNWGITCIADKTRIEYDKNCLKYSTKYKEDYEYINKEERKRKIRGKEKHNVVYGEEEEEDGEYVDKVMFPEYKQSKIEKKLKLFNQSSANKEDYVPIQKEERKIKLTGIQKGYAPDEIEDEAYVKPAPKIIRKKKGKEKEKQPLRNNCYPNALPKSTQIPAVAVFQKKLISSEAELKLFRRGKIFDTRNHRERKNSLDDYVTPLCKKQLINLEINDVEREMDVNIYKQKIKYL